MTCIAAIAANGVVWMGGDSQGTYENSNSIISLKTPKVFRIGPYLVGNCGTLLVGNSLLYHTELPDPPKTGLMRFLSHKVVPVFRKSLQERGNSYGFPGTTGILLGVLGKLFMIDANSQHYEVRESYHAIGTGEAVARGSLHTSACLCPKKSPKVRLKLALETAEKYNNSVRGPFVILRGAHV